MEPHATPKAVALLGARWSPQAGTLTSSMKVDRKAIALSFSAELARLAGGHAGLGLNERIVAYLTATDDARAAAVLAWGLTPAQHSLRETATFTRELCSQHVSAYQRS